MFQKLQPAGRIFDQRLWIQSLSTGVIRVTFAKLLRGVEKNLEIA